MKLRAAVAAIALVASSAHAADPATLRQAESIAMDLARGNVAPIKAVLAMPLLHGSPANVEEFQAQYARDIVTTRRIRAATVRREEGSTCTIVVPIVGATKTYDLVLVLKGCEFANGSLVGYRLQPHSERPADMYERDEARIETPPYVEETALVRRTLELTTEDDTRAAIFCAPRSGTKKKIPAVLLIGPPGAADIDGLADGARPLRDIADALAANGVCVLRIAPRAATLRDAGYEPRASINETDLADARAAFELLTSQPEADDARVYIAGFSTGSAIALKLAAKESRAHGLVLLGPPVRYNLAAELRGFLARTQISESEIGRLQSAANIISERSGIDVARFGFRPSSWWDSAAEIDPVDLSTSFSGPAYFGFAERDATVSHADVERWRKALAKRKSTATGFYAGADASFARTTPRPADEPPASPFVAPEVLRDIIRFILVGEEKPARVTSPERAVRGSR